MWVRFDFNTLWGLFMPNGTRIKPFSTYLSVFFFVCCPWLEKRLGAHKHVKFCHFWITYLGQQPVNLWLSLVTDFHTLKNDSNVYLLYLQYMGFFFSWSFTNVSLCKFIEKWSNNWLISKLRRSVTWEWQKKNQKE